MLINLVKPEIEVAVIGKHEFKANGIRFKVYQMAKNSLNEEVLTTTCKGHVVTSTASHESMKESQKVPNPMTSTNYFILTVILCGHFLPFSIAVNMNELQNYINTIIMDHFRDECVCFFKHPYHYSTLFATLVENVAKEKMVTLVTSVEETLPINIYRQEPLKPYPCSYVVFLPYVGSDIPWSLLRGFYFSSGFHSNESRYLIVAEAFHTRSELEEVLINMFIYGFLNVNFVNFPNAHQVDIYTFFPFGKDFESCPEDSLATEEVVKWQNGKIKQSLPMFPQKVPHGPFKGCLWNISCAYFPPYLLVKDGGQFIGPLDGYDAGPLSLVTERLNLTPKWNIDSRNFWLTIDNETVSGSMPDLVLGRGAQMSCGGISQYWNEGNTDATMFYTWSALQWFAAAPDKVPKWKMLIFALNKSIWPSVLACALIVPSIYWAMCIFIKQRQPFSKILLSFTALSFGNFTSPPPVASTLRLVFVSWLIYVLHIDQFYLASLTGLITSAGYEPLIKTADELLASNLPTRGFPYTGRHLNQSTKEAVHKLVMNFIPIARLNRTLQEMTIFKNFTLAENNVFVKHELSMQHNVSIYPTWLELEDYIVSAFMWRHNYLFDRINWILFRMFDAGFPMYFLRKFVPPNQFWSDPMDKTAKPLTLEDLSGPFYILIIGLSLSLAVFLCEIVLFKLSLPASKPKKKRFDRFLR